MKLETTTEIWGTREPRPPVLDAAGEPLLVRLQRWPVMAKKKTEDEPTEIVRTRAPTEERTVRVVEWERPGYCFVAFGDTDIVRVSPFTGRAAGLPDWIVAEPSLAELRVLRRKRFRRKKEAAVAAAEPTADSASGEEQGNEAEDEAEVPREAEVHVRVRNRDGRVLTLDAGLPRAIVRSGETPRGAAVRALYEAVGGIVESPSTRMRVLGALLYEERLVTIFDVHVDDVSETGAGEWATWEAVCEGLDRALYAQLPADPPLTD